LGWAPRNRSCARRERWDRLGIRAVARGGFWCRRSYARCGPIPLPLCAMGNRGASPWGSLGFGGVILGFGGLWDWCVGLGWAPRNRYCARRERWGRFGIRAVARGGFWCRRSYARSGPISLALGAMGSRGASPWVSLGFGGGSRVLEVFGNWCVELGWAPRDRSCARRERWDRLGVRAVARGRFWCRRSYARCGPIPLPLGAMGSREASPWVSLGFGG